MGGWESRADRREIVSRVARLGISSRYIFVGEVSDPLNYFALGDVFTLTSREEPFGIVALEASMVGLPIVCFEDAGGMSEFVGDDAGVRVPYLDVSAMAEAVFTLCEERQLAKSRNSRAMEKARVRHSVPVGAQSILDLIDRVLGATDATA